MKVNQTYCIDYAIVEWLKEKKNKSALVNDLLRLEMESEKTSNIQMITCPSCETKYSSRIKECPGCIEEKLKQLKKETEKDQATADSVLNAKVVEEKRRWCEHCKKDITNTLSLPDKKKNCPYCYGRILTPLTKDPTSD